MAVDFAAHLFAAVPQLRIHPTAKRLRASVGGEVVVDTTAGLIVWEPRRIVPSYAAPVADVRAELTPSTATAGEERPVIVGGGPPVLDPSSPFTVHTCEGTSYDVGALPAAAFTPADPDLAGYVVLDFNAFDEWLEEDEVLVGHARDPFKRIDTRRSDRHVRVELGGVVLADSTRPTLLFETHLPTRYYLPAGDVRTDLLSPSERRTVCAYKGPATYLSAPDAPDVAWTLREPEHDGLPVKDMICFFNERVDLILDGERLERPTTPWS
jgi:uncharacterized protein (DUF427 family)